MKILSIETSCDESAISILEVEGIFGNPNNPAKFKIIADNLISQIDIHKEFGGVFPAVAKREHSKNLIPVLRKTLSDANSSTPRATISKKQDSKYQLVEKILEREPKLFKLFMEYIPTIEVPKIDVIAVTQGPGLEPALWVGINFAKALALVWDKPLIPVNHMKGHILSAFTDTTEFTISEIQFPAIALLLSGGHTELVLMKDFDSYEKIGQTLDDAVGEAFDKVARMMDLPYPGGPEISKLANNQRTKKSGDETPTDLNKIKTVDVGYPQIKLPRPMLNSDDLNFSFSGLKTAVLYLIKKLKKENNWTELPLEIKQQIALEFEESVIEVLLKKTQKALEQFEASTLILGGGVTASKAIRENFEKLSNKNLKVLLPNKNFSTDNAVMIGIAAYAEYPEQNPNPTDGQEKRGQSLKAIGLDELRADGNLNLS